MTPSPPRHRAPLFADAIDRLPISGAFKRFIVPQKLGRIYSGEGTECEPRAFAADVLQKLQVRYQVTDTDLARVPKTGPVIVVSNHPFGMLEGLILIDMLSRIRPHVKLLANSILASVPELRSGLILVDPFDTAVSTRANRKGVKETLSFLASGGLLIVFPAGEVSHVQLRERRIADPGWNENIARFIRHSSVTVVPIFIGGTNSLTFQLMGMIHAQLRTARLLHELVNKEQKSIELQVGNAIPWETLRSLSSDAEITRYLRYRTYLLENRGHQAPRFPGLPRPPILVRKPVAVADSRPVGLLEEEITRLPVLAQSGELQVFRAKAAEIPEIIQEIGRLRELTFRQAGEGTGKAADLDRFDRYYHHLFLWDNQAKQVVGAYRLGVTSEILPRMGIEGLYTSTLFGFHERFFRTVGPSIEMGRSFVRPEYQRQYGPLLLLWRGIGTYVASHPENPVLFGPVSISNDYHPVSRRLIVRYLQQQESIRALSVLIRPRRRFRTGLRGTDNEAITLMLRDSDELSAITADIETDGKGIPVLLRQYLKLGGKLLGFSVDPEFSNALDGLILVDLRQTSPAILSRYLGRDGSARFLGYHQIAGRTTAQSA